MSDLAIATYCPRKLHYAREDDRKPPPIVEKRRELAFAYPELLAGTDDELSARAIAISPESYRNNLETSRARLDVWDAIVDPEERDAFLTGRECRGIVQKVLAPENRTPMPSLVFAGSPPEAGVWKPQAVRAVGAAKALAWEREVSVEAAIVEYPAHGVIRRLPLTTRRLAAYRKAIRTIESMDGVPPRIRNRSKCSPCQYRETCGVRTRSLRSLLRLG